MNFTTFDELKGHVSNDLKLVVTIRFVNVDSLDLWIKVKSWLTDICTKSLRLSDFCGGDDLTPNINRLISNLKKIRESTLLIPLSEYLRINNKKTNDIVSKIINLEFENDNEQNALFIPMYRMKTVLSEFIKEDLRYENKILFLETTEDDDYSLTIVSSDLNVDLKGYDAMGFKRYLAYWEGNPDKPIVLRTNNVKFYKDIITTDDVKVFITDFDVLKYHYNIIEISAAMGVDWQWKELLKRMNSDKILSGVFAGLFNITKYNAKYLLEKWNGCTDFEKWAIWLWSKLESTDGYLRMVLDTGCGSDTFIENIIDLICKIDTKDNRYDEFYRQRKEYLKCISIETLPKSFWDEIANIKKPAQRLYYLTDCTSAERCETIKTIESEGLNEKFMGIVEATDPFLMAYIEPYRLESEKYTDYFAEYKRQKISNTVNCEFIDKVRKYAASKGPWWELCSRNKLIDDAYDKGKGTIIFWIDALGVEYLSLIGFMLRERHPGVYCRVGVGYANIPTITELNKDFLQGREHINFRELDELKHKGEYPEYIVKEFTLIEKALNKAVEKLSEYKKVIITSDHGASRLAVIALTHTHKAKESAVVLRHGRYCEDNQNDYGGDISGCVDKDQYHVFADYDRFSIQGNVTGEIHGGASLEEVLVPVIELSKRPFSAVVTDAAVTITVLTPVIKLRAGQKVIVKFQIGRDFDKLHAEVGHKRYDCVRDIDCWYFEPEVDRNINDYKARLLYKGRALGTIQYKIQKGITSTLDI